MKRTYTMCDDHNCPLKDNCWRYLEEIDKTKTDHFAFSPYKKGKCNFHEPLTEDDLIERVTNFIKPFNN